LPANIFAMLANILAHRANNHCASMAKYWVSSILPAKLFFFSVQVGIFETWDWITYRHFPILVGTTPKLVQLPFYMLLSARIPVLRIFCFKNIQKITFWDPILSLRGIGSNIPAVFLGET
jgi:hypothetical protein